MRSGFQCKVDKTSEWSFESQSLLNEVRFPISVLQRNILAVVASQSLLNEVRFPMYELKGFHL